MPAIASVPTSLVINGLLIRSQTELSFGEVSETGLSKWRIEYDAPELQPSYRIVEREIAMNAENLTPELAYLAMYEFLAELYQRTKSDELGSLLGSMSYLADGETADPAVWTDWMRCVTKVLVGEGDAKLKLR